MKREFCGKLCSLLAGTFMLVFVGYGFIASSVTLAAENGSPPKVIFSAGGNTIGGPGVFTAIPGEIVTIYEDLDPTTKTKICVTVVIPTATSSGLATIFLTRDGISQAFPIGNAVGQQNGGTTLCATKVSEISVMLVSEEAPTLYWRVDQFPERLKVDGGDELTLQILVTPDRSGPPNYGWVKFLNGTKQWIDWTCRDSLEASGVAVTILPWDEIDQYPDGATYIDCQALLAL